MGRQDEIVKERMRKISELKASKINPYPQPVENKDYASALQSKYTNLKPEEKAKESVRVTGRLMGIRDMGKIAFGVLQDSSGKIQVLLQEPDTPKETFDFINKYIDSGDFIAVEGKILRTKRGELSVLVKKAQLLSKSIMPLPDKWHGLEDKEERYRKRYLDLIMSPEVKQVFEKRAKIIDIIRAYLKENEFIEVEIPTLQSIYGGASAKPFMTHLNALDIELYLSISPELHLKRLIVGGFERVFTICKNFRNEGIDRQHNPEFTMLEFYYAYQNYEKLIEMTEELISKLVKETNGSNKIEYQGKSLDFKTPFRRITFRDLVLKESGIDIDKSRSFDSLRKAIQEKDLRDVQVNNCKHYGDLLDELYKRVCRPNIIQPTILTHYPVEMIALAKRNEKDPSKINSFQLIIDGAEIVKAYDELNDPIDQRERLMEQQKLLQQGAEEAMPLDEDFLNALEVGMPPTAGYGLGIDRLTMMLTNSQSIRDVILFPFMKPETKKTEPMKSEDKNENTPFEEKDKFNTSMEDISKMPKRAESLDLLNKYVKSESLIKHCLAVEASMRAYARKYGESEEVWGTAGLLHDFDYEQFPDQHPKPGVEILKGKDYPNQIIQAILAHATERTGIKRRTQLDKVLFAVDELSGLLVALSKVRKDGFKGMDANSVEKALKKKEFAKGVSRADVEEGIKDLGVDRAEHFMLMINALEECLK